MRAIKSVVVALAMIVVLGPATAPVRAQYGIENLVPLIVDGMNRSQQQEQYERQRRYEQRQQRQRQQNRTQAGKPRQSGQSTEPKLSPDQVFVLQYQLREQGYDVGTPDGAIGKRTREALAAHQEAIGQEPTGLFTRQQVRDLLQGAPTAGGITASEPDLVSPGEFRTLQAALKRAGYRIGKVDGLPGPQTASAISAYLQAQGLDPYQSSVRQAYDIAVGGADPQSGDASTAYADSAHAMPDSRAGPRQVDPGQYLSASSSPGFDLDRALARVAIHDVPTLLDNDHVVERWFKADYPRSRQEESELARRYHSGTQFDQADVLKSFATALRSEALAPPLKVAIERVVNVSAGFVAGKGFPLVHNSGRPNASQVSEYVGRIGGQIEMNFEDAPDVSHLPMADEGEARRFATRLKAGPVSVSITQYVTINGIQGSGSDGYVRSLFVDAVLDKVTITAEGHTYLDWTPPPKEAASSSNGMSAPAFGKYAGIELIAGRLAGSETYSMDRGWRQFAWMALLGVQPDLLDRDDLLIAYAASTLGKSDLVSLAAPANAIGDPSLNSSRMNEFEKRDLVQRIRDGYLPKILAKVPANPMPTMEVYEIGLGEYDFDKRTFPLGFAQGSKRAPGDQIRIGMSRATEVPQQFEIGLREFPSSVPMKAQAAQRLLRSMENGQRRLFLSIKWDLSYASAPGTRDTLSVKLVPIEMAVFADRDLSRHLHTFELAPYLARTEAPDGDALEVQRVIDIPAAPPHVFIRAANRRERMRGVLESYLRTNHEYRQTNEFKRDEVLQKVRQEVEGYPYDDDSLWLAGEVSLGPYDGGRGGFTVTSVSVAYGQSELGHFSNAIKLSLFNQSRFSFVPVARAEAAAAVERNPGRRFPIKMRVAISDGVWDGNDTDPKLDLVLTVREFYVLDVPRDKATRPRTLARLSGEALEGATPTASSGSPLKLPDRPILSQDLILTLAAQERADVLSEQSLRWFLANRWLHDSGDPTTLPARFFEPGAPPPADNLSGTYAKAYRDWLKGLKVEFPKKVMIRWDRSRGSPTACDDMVENMVWGMVPPSMQVPDMREVYNGPEIDPDRSASSQPIGRPGVHLGFYRTSALECSRNGEASKLVSQYVGHKADWWPRTFVVFDELPVPQMGTRGKRAEIDAMVTNVTLIENGDEMPSVRVDLKLEQVRFLDDPAGPSSVSARTPEELAAAATENAAAAAVVRDVLAIHVGQTLGEADKIARAHLANPLVFEANSPMATNLASFQNARLYLRPDGFEAVAVFVEGDQEAGDERPVLGVMRQLVTPPGEFDANQVIPAVKAKYGEPLLEQAQFNRIELVWGRGVAQPGNGGKLRPSHCRVGLGGGIPIRWTKDGQHVENIAQFTPWPEVREHGFLNWPSLHQPADEHYASCGEFLNVVHTSSRRNGSIFLLVDIGAYHKALKKAFEPDQVPATSSDGPDHSGSGAPLKL